MMDYRPLDPKNDWEFFDPDLAVPTSYLARIHPLTAESAAALWREFVSQDAEHPMQLADHAWPGHLYSSPVRANWQTDWNDDAATGFAEWLRASLPWPSDASVIFTHSSLRSIETSWEVFVSCWRSFLFADEGPFLWSLQHPQAVGFSPAGFACVGRRLPFVAAT